MVDEDLGAIVAVDGTQFAGVVTIQDAENQHGMRIDGGPLRVRDVPLDDRRRCRKHGSKQDALAIMNATSCDWLAVFDDHDELRGLISRKAIGDNEAIGDNDVPPDEPEDSHLLDRSDEDNPGLRVHSEKPSLKG